MSKLDALDCQILNLLQDDATLPLKTLAEHLGTSIATAQRRLARLYDDKIIKQAVAIVDNIKVGCPLTVLTLIKMRQSNTHEQHQFERLMAKLPQVMICYEISGDYDFALIVNGKDMQDYHRFTRKYLHADNNVMNFNSQFVMNTVKAGTKITLQAT